MSQEESILLIQARIPLLLSDSNLKEHMNFPVSLAIDNGGEFYVSDQYGSGMAVVGRDWKFPRP